MAVRARWVQHHPNREWVLTGSKSLLLGLSHSCHLSCSSQIEHAHVGMLTDSRESHHPGNNWPMARRMRPTAVMTEGVDTLRRKASVSFSSPSLIHNDYSPASSASHPLGLQHLHVDKQTNIDRSTSLVKLRVHIHMNSSGPSRTCCNKRRKNRQCWAWLWEQAWGESTPIVSGFSVAPFRPISSFPSSPQLSNCVTLLVATHILFTVLEYDQF